MVQAANGVRARYDVLLIATGSRAFIPPMQGSEQGGRQAEARHLRLPHHRRLRRRSWRRRRQSQRAVVIGGGLLGLEAARGLLNHGCEVHVVHLGRHLMEAQLDATGGGMLCTAMREDGRHIHLETLTDR